MSSQKLNRRLSTLDAGFLYFEKKEAPMHIGSVHLFEGEVSFEDFVAMMDAKMHLVPRYRQIVRPDPFNLGHPTWEFDPHFDVRNHVFKIQIDAPGGEAELIELSGKIFTPVMERDKPLWDIYWVYGLEGGNTARAGGIRGRLWLRDCELRPEDLFRPDLRPAGDARCRTDARFPERVVRRTAPRVGRRRNEAASSRS